MGDMTEYQRMLAEIEEQYDELRRKSGNFWRGITLAFIICAIFWAALIWAAVARADGWDRWQQQEQIDLQRQQLWETQRQNRQLQQWRSQQLLDLQRQQLQQNLWQRQQQLQYNAPLQPMKPLQPTQPWGRQ